MSRRGRILLLALVAVATLALASRTLRRAAPTAPRGAGPILPYAGAFADDPRYRALAGRLSALLERATREAAAALAVPADPSRIRLRLVDDAAGAAWTREFVARTIVGSLGPATIELRLEPLLAGRVGVEGVVRHEATHAVMGRFLGATYARVPEWLREGIAVHVAGETTTCLSRAISLTALRPIELLADGLSRDAHGAADYAEGGLAVATLRSLAGEDAVPRLVACLAAEAAWPPCLSRLAGMTPERFEARALLDALDAVGTLAADRVGRYAAAQARLREGDAAAALAEYEALLGLRGPFDLEARLGAARALALLGRPREALAHTRALVEQGDYGPELGVELLALEASVSREAGLEARAVAACDTLRRYYARDGGSDLDECVFPLAARAASAERG